PAKEVFRVGEVLPDQPGADQLAVLDDQAAVGLVVKDDLGDARDDERIDQSGDNRDHQRQASRAQQFGWERANDGFRTSHARCTAVMRMSINLMPAKGAMMPPTPQSSRLRRSNAAAPIGR